MSVKARDVYDLTDPLGPTITFEIIRISNGWTTYTASFRDAELRQLHQKTVTTQKPPPFLSGAGFAKVSGL